MKPLVGILALLGLMAGGHAAMTVESLARNVERVESIREVKDIQKTFAQLAQYGRWPEMAALFSEQGILRWGSGKGNILDTSDATSVVGPGAIETWLRTDAGDMDGIRPGSLHSFVNEMPVVTLSADGRTAKGRWHVLRLMGNGAGKTRIQGGLFENEYTFITGNNSSNKWKISLLRYYPMFIGDYKNGWKNPSNNTLPIVPYHFTPDDAGIPVQVPDDSKQPRQNTTVSLDIQDLAYRVDILNEEDEVRNLQHAYGYYLDRRMWTDVVDLFASDGTIRIDGAMYTGPGDIRKFLERFGPEGLTQGILNDHPIYEMVVEIAPQAREAVARGLEVGMLGDSTKHNASWEFSVFRSHLIKDLTSGIWKIKDLNYTRLMSATYGTGWGDGGTVSRNFTAQGSPPPFPDVISRTSRVKRPGDYQPFWRDYLDLTNSTTSDDLGDVGRRLSRSAAFDETENISGAYGYFADDIRCGMFAALHAAKGFKESPGIGWYLGPKRIEQSCTSRYGTGSSNPQRPRVPFHWRPQPVISVSHDGRSTSLRARILQTGTSTESNGGFSGVYGFNGGMYHDQFILEDYNNGTSRRKLWCLTIDEFYWQSSSWAAGWAGVGGKSNIAMGQPGSQLSRRQSSGDLPADVQLKDPKMGEREVGLNGGPVTAVHWPNIVRMWWGYRNPVSGRVPDSYWAPGCVPCRTARPDWALTSNGYQEPPTGPTQVTAAVAGTNVTVRVQAGPDEPISGFVELRLGDRSDNLIGFAQLSNGSASISIPPGNLPRTSTPVDVFFLGSERLLPGKTTVQLKTG